VPSSISRRECHAAVWRVDIATIEVHRTGDIYAPILEHAKSVVEEQYIAQRAASEMLQAVTSEGMTLEKFDEILTNAHLDPEVADRVGDKIDQFLKNPISR
jgi:hypothetical protein